MTREEGCLYWLTLVKGLGHKRIEKLLDVFGSAGAAFDAGEKEWEAAVGPALAAEMGAQHDPKKLNENYRRLRAMGVELVTRAHPQYPSLLLQTEDAPFALYAKGDLSLLEAPAAAVVGSRNCTRYGERAARYFSEGLVRGGAAVVSGLARGVDSIAQTAALDAGGKCIAVLGTGIDVCYPRENAALQQRIAKEGLLLTEHAPGTQPQAWHFPARNRIMAGLSRAVLVVEADENSGSLITAGCAVDYDRELFVVPGPIFSPGSRGSNLLLQTCALPALAPQDVLTAMGLHARPPAPEEAAPALPKDVTPEEERVLKALLREELSFDELVDMLGFAPGKLNSLLTTLEMREIISKSPGRRYSLSGR